MQDNNNQWQAAVREYFEEIPKLSLYQTVFQQILQKHGLSLETCEHEYKVVAFEGTMETGYRCTKCGSDKR